MILHQKDLRIQSQSHLSTAILEAKAQEEKEVALVKQK